MRTIMGAILLIAKAAFLLLVYLVLWDNYHSLALMAWAILIGVFDLVCIALAVQYLRWKIQ